MIMDIHDIQLLLVGDKTAVSEASAGLQYPILDFYDIELGFLWRT
ncbi:hypothetical protein BH11CYA1_BH11CYA1_12220 [soil metagenome]